jgi:HAD superfamily hydrolase (TIGR01549 family)
MSDIIANNKNFNNIELILFDKDGTLIDIHHYWVSMIKIRAKFLVKKYFNNTNDKVKNKLIDLMGVDINNNKMKPEGPVGIKERAFIVSIVTCFLIENKVDVSESEIENLFKEVDESTETDILSLLKVLPNVRELLQNLKDCHIKMAIVSTDITHRAITSMKALKLDDFFDIIVGGDAVEKSKPSADLALYVMNKLNISANRTLVIGDHPVDMHMAKSAKIFANIGVLTGISTQDAFLSENIEIVDNLNLVRVEC